MAVGRTGWGEIIREKLYDNLEWVLTGAAVSLIAYAFFRQAQRDTDAALARLAAKRAAQGEDLLAQAKQLNLQKDVLSFVDELHAVASKGKYWSKSSEELFQMVLNNPKHPLHGKLIELLDTSKTLKFPRDFGDIIKQAIDLKRPISLRPEALQSLPSWEELKKVNAAMYQDVISRLSEEALAQLPQ